MLPYSRTSGKTFTTVSIEQQIRCSTRSMRLSPQVTPSPFQNCRSPLFLSAGGPVSTKRSKEDVLTENNFKTSLSRILLPLMKGNVSFWLSMRPPSSDPVLKHRPIEQWCRCITSRQSAKRRKERRSRLDGNTQQ